MKNLSKKLISVIMALLLTIAPFGSAFAIKIPWLTTYPSEKEIVETLGNFLKARDVDGIAGMFSEEVKSGITDLNDRVKNFLTHIDCEIKDYTFRGRGGSEERNNGYYHKSVSFHILITSNEQIFDVIATYIQAWTDDEKSIGLYSLNLTLEKLDRQVIDYLDDISIPSSIMLNYKETYQCASAEQESKKFYASLGYQKAVFESSNESVATVNESGMITATGRGSARVTITYINEATGKELKDEYDVTVTFTRWQWIIWYLFFGFLWY